MADPDSPILPEPDGGSSDSSGKVHDLGRDTGAQRLRRLQIEAHKLAREQVEILTQDLRAVAARATEIAEAGDLYPLAARELCSRLADELMLEGQSLTAIMAREAPDR